MKRTLATIAFAAALLVPSGILSTAASASTPNLSAKLLSIGQMPTGWAVNNTPGNGLGCLAKILEPKAVKQTASVSVEFEDNGNVPEVSESLATFANAKTGYQKIVANLTTCKRLSGTTGGQKFSGSVGQASFPHYGNASAAFEATFTIQGESLGEDILIVREGSIVMGIAEGDYPPVDTGQFQGFIAKALKKLG